MIVATIQEINPYWNGYLYRSGGPGIYYHTEKEGAEFYGDDIEVYDCPDVDNVALIDIEGELANIEFADTFTLEDIAKILGMSMDEVLGYHLANAIEDALPFLFKKYEAVIIHGETGAHVTGTPIEIVTRKPLTPLIGPEAAAALLSI